MKQNVNESCREGKAHYDLGRAWKASTLSLALPNSNVRDEASISIQNEQALCLYLPLRGVTNTLNRQARGYSAFLYGHFRGCEMQKFLPIRMERNNVCSQHLHNCDTSNIFCWFSFSNMYWATASHIMSTLFRRPNYFRSAFRPNSDLPFLDSPFYNQYLH